MKTAKPLIYGGKTGIRTLGTIASTTDFESDCTPVFYYSGLPEKPALEAFAIAA